MIVPATRPPRQVNLERKEWLEGAIAVGLFVQAAVAGANKNNLAQLLELVWQEKLQFGFNFPMVVLLALAATVTIAFQTNVALLLWGVARLVDRCMRWWNPERPTSFPTSYVGNRMILPIRVLGALLFPTLGWLFGDSLDAEHIDAAAFFLGLFFFAFGLCLWLRSDSGRDCIKSDMARV